MQLEYHLKTLSNKYTKSSRAIYLALKPFLCKCKNWKLYVKNLEKRLKIFPRYYRSTVFCSKFPILTM